MRVITYREEGVATAVGAILTILVFVILLTVFVTSYLPAEMTGYEETYSSNLMKSVMEVDSSVNLLFIEFRDGEIVTVPFSLESGSVPVISSPTVGTLSILPSSSGFISVSNDTTKISSSGGVSAETNNRYYVDQIYYYELSTIINSQEVNGSSLGNIVESNLITAQRGDNGTIILSVHLVNLEGGPISISYPGPVILNLEAFSEQEYQLNGNVTIFIQSQFSQQIYSLIAAALAPFTSLSIQHTITGDNLSLSISPNGATVMTDVSEITIMGGLSS